MKKRTKILLFTITALVLCAIVSVCVALFVFDAFSSLKGSKGLEYVLNEDEVSYSVTGIGTCTDTDIVIPKRYKGCPVTSIGSSAFVCCYNLESVIIPDSVTTIGDSAFKGCSITSVTIGNSVTTIGDEAFLGCYSLESVIIPNSVTTIGNDAFIRCYNLESVIIPDSVTTIGDSAFGGCSSLTSVTIGNSVTSIGFSAFSYCDNLESVIIPNSVTTIGDDAFSNCSSLISVTVPDSVTTIGDDAFYLCDSLESVTIPDSVTTIGTYAFACCANLKNIEVDEDNEYYKDIDGSLYTKDGKTLVQYAIGKSDTSFTIPDGVTTIGDSAFYYCDSRLTSVTVPDSVTTIGNSAFSGCSSLTSVTIGNGVETIEEYAFSSCYNLTDVYYGGSEAEWNNISIGYENEYLTDATVHYTPETNTLQIATSPDYPPFQYLEGDEIVGIEVDLVELICERLGYKIEWKHMDYVAVCDSIQTGKYKVAASGIVIDDDFEALFSDSYFVYSTVIVVRADSSISSKADLAGKNVSVQSGTYAEEFCRDEGYTVDSYEANADAKEALKAGKVDAWVVGSATAKKMCENDASVKILSETMVDDKYAIAFSYGNEELVAKFNVVINQLIEEGKMAEIFAKYGEGYEAPDTSDDENTWIDSDADWQGKPVPLPVS